jgi:hypothetical protein
MQPSVHPSKKSYESVREQLFIRPGLPMNTSGKNYEYVGEQLFIRPGLPVNLSE